MFQFGKLSIQNLVCFILFSSLNSVYSQVNHSNGMCHGEMPEKMRLSEVSKKEMFYNALIESQIPLLSESKSIHGIVNQSVKYYENDIITGKLIYGTEENEYLNSIADKIVQNTPELKNVKLDFFIDRNHTVNASCLFHKEIRLNVGLLSYVQNEAELAFVIAHEISHYLLFHTARSIQNAESIYTNEKKNKSPFSSQNALEISRKHELEADSLGLILMKNAGYNGKFALDALKILDESDQSYAQENFEIAQIFGQAYHIPLCYTKQQIQEVIRDREYYDKHHTHPSIQQRLNILQVQLANNATNLQPYLVSEEKFKRMQENMRLVHLKELFVSSEYTEVLYNSCSLLSLYPQRKEELKSFMAMALYAMAKFKTNNKMGEIVLPINRTPGQKQKLIQFYKDLDQNQFNGIVLKFLFENKSCFKDLALWETMMKNVYVDFQKQMISGAQITQNEPDAELSNKIKTSPEELSPKDRFELQKEVKTFYLYGFSNSLQDYIRNIKNEKSDFTKAIIYPVLINQSDYSSKKIKTSLEKSQKLDNLSFDNRFLQSIRKIPQSTQEYNEQIRLYGWLRELNISTGQFQPLIYASPIQKSNEFNQIVHFVFVYNNERSKKNSVHQSFIPFGDVSNSSILEFDHNDYKFQFKKLYLTHLSKLTQL